MLSGNLSALLSAPLIYIRLFEKILAPAHQAAYTATMKFIGYFLFVLIMAFSGWANAHPQKPDCMMKEMAHAQAQQQNCDKAMPACGDQHHASSKPCCKLTVDCQSSSLGVVAILLNVLPPPSETVYHSTSDSLPLSSANSNVWRPPARA